MKASNSDEVLDPGAEQQGRDRAAALLGRVQALEELVETAAAAVMALWRDRLHDPEFAGPANNLAAYLALREGDQSQLQDDLARLGLSSLGRCESHVVPTLQAVRASLARMAGAGDRKYPPDTAWEAGENRLARLKASLFAAHGDGPGIMVTLPTAAAEDFALVEQLVRSGMTCARINCAHDDPDAWRKMCDHVRRAAAEQRTECRILMDLPGPKCRIETVSPEKPKRLHVGDCFRLLTADVAGATPDTPSITIGFPALIAQLKPGLAVWINDGKIRSRIVEACEGGWVLEVTSARLKGERLKPEKGVGLPGVDLGLPALSSHDLEDLDFICAHADLVGYSFVQRPADVQQLDRELSARAGGARPLPLVLKIETAEAVRNLPHLIVQAGGLRPCGVMIARGDLAVDVGFGRLAEIQEEILWLCQAASVPVVWATQVLDDLVRDGLPSRSEATDAAMAHRAECVMLNKGPFLPEAIEFLTDVFARMDRHQHKKVARYTRLRSWPLDRLGFATTEV